MSQIPVQNADTWYRDSKTGSLSCADENTYEKYMKNYRAAQDKEKQMETLQTEVSELKSDMSEIKSLLLTLVQKS